MGWREVAERVDNGRDVGGDVEVPAAAPPARYSTNRAIADDQTCAEELRAAAARIRGLIEWTHSRSPRNPRTQVSQSLTLRAEKRSV